MIPDYLSFALAAAAVVYSVHTVIDLFLMLREYRDSKKVDLKNEGLSAYIR